MNKKIRFLIMDVDGTLTDGKLHISEQGELFKSFDAKDGYGIKDVLPKHYIIPVIITARSSKVLSVRCKELNIDQVYQGVFDKKAKLDEILNAYSQAEGTIYSYENCAYIGDDIPDLQCMCPIHDAGGITACPSDASEEVMDMVDLVCNRSGGNGAVREFIDWFIHV